MNIYHYRPETKVFVGMTQADPDPLVEGGWLIPAYATPVAPPRITAGNQAVWLGDSWKLEPIPVPPPAPTAPFEPVVPSKEIQRRGAYAAEADPLFFKWQRGEGTQSAWLAKVAEIKARYP